MKGYYRQLLMLTGEKATIFEAVCQVGLTLTFVQFGQTFQMFRLAMFTNVGKATSSWLWQDGAADVVQLGRAAHHALAGLERLPDAPGDMSRVKSQMFAVPQHFPTLQTSVSKS